MKCSKNQEKLIKKLQLEILHLRDKLDTRFQDGFESAVAEITKLHAGLEKHMLQATAKCKVKKKRKPLKQKSIKRKPKIAETPAQPEPEKI